MADIHNDQFEYHMAKKKKVVKKPLNRKTKTHLIFNEESRRDFLKGFKKRKDERRKKARQIMELQLKEEKKQIKDQRRNSLKQYMQNQRTVPEVEHILEPVVYDLPEHVITISTATNIDLTGHDNMRLGLNKGELDDETNDTKELQKNSLKKSSKILEKSKAFQMKQRLKQKKDRQKQRNLKMRNKNVKKKKRNVLKEKKKKI